MTAVLQCVSEIRFVQNAGACRGVLAHARGLTKKGDDGKKFIPLLTSRISGLNNILLTN